MIIAIVNQHGNPDRSVIARNLAVLRARSGRRVCLMHTARDDGWGAERGAAAVRPWIDTRQVGSRAVKTRLAALRPLFNDILVDAGARDTEECRCVLASARLVVVPVRGAEIDLDCQYRLLARLNAARVFNPGMRVLFVAVCGAGGPLMEERAAVLAHVTRVQDASLANVVLHQPAAHDYGPGRCVSDAETCDPESAAEMHALYDEVYATLPKLSTLPAAQLGAAHALWG
ncbi:hypothetical protein SOM61_18645 [Massilia sp. CFBP9012]|uniref:hypothetical protein n=1 Tax=Massilia sp. CFBP9012 TaxID=3096531 RepID=UPI002A6B7FC1|nr:hypothetical protein [Massilia sp. CFBP9012]MDY0976988.1 hypothetical protein [Massilia sp. CFBP9012]